jgi:hypothetical protein
LKSAKVICQTSLVKTTGFCWNKEWCRPYESPWSLFEKLKFANQASNRDILSIIGSQFTIDKRTYNVTKRERNLTTLNGFNSDKLRDIFGVSPEAEMESFFQRFVSILPSAKNSLQEQMKQDLAYCTLCMKQGYHSFIHQLSFIDSCPFHNRKLRSKCAKCEATIPYLLNHAKVIEPYQCPRCNTYLYEPTSNFVKEWRVNNQRIRNRTIKSWISINDAERDDIAALIMPYSKINQTKLARILKVVGRTVSTTDQYHRVIKSSNRLMKYDNHLKEYINACQTYNETNILHVVTNTNRAIHKSTEDIVRSISKYVRRSLISHHLTCIKSAQRGFSAPQCPYAFAYLHWKKSVEYRRSIGQVDKHPLDRGRLHYFHPSFASFRHSNNLSWVLTKWAGQNGHRKYESLTVTKWILNRVLGHCLIQYFYDWLHFASVRELLNPEEYRYQHEYEILPYKYDQEADFIIKLPINSQMFGAFEFHYWDDQKYKKKSDLNLSCPYGK